MTRLIYKGKVSKDTNQRDLLYTFNRVVANGLVEVTHQSSGDILYYSQEQYKKLFKK